METFDFSRRDTGIDLLRALTMFVMIFVNDFWTVSGVPHWLEHAAVGEDFMGLADVVFPLFLFVVGMSVPLAIEGRYTKGLSDLSTLGHILSRTLALLVMGVFIVNSEARLSAEAACPIGVYWILMVTGFILIWNVKTKWFLQAAGVLILGYLAFTFRSSDGGVFSARWWGILGSIGWSYLVCAVVYLFTRDRLRYLLPVLVAFLLICVLGTKMRSGVPILNLPRPNFYNDILGVLHIGNGSGGALVMGGLVFSLVARRLTAVRKMLLAGGMVVLGVLARQVWIVSKIGGTPPWVFFIFAIAIGVYTVLGLADEKWFAPIKPAGTATLTCYLVPYVFYALASLTGWGLPEVLTHGAMGIVNCLCFALFVIGVTWALGRVGIKLKI